MSLVQIPGTTLIRDTTSMALINKDQNGLQDYLKKRQTLAHQKEELNNVKIEMQDIKQDMQEIKQLILQLLGKGSNG
jgi:hypothetical protein